MLTFILRTFGKTYEPDCSLPLSFVVRTMARRAIWLAMGFVRFRKAVFIAPGAKISGKSRIKLGLYATIEPGARVDGIARRGVYIGARSKIGAGSIISCTSHMSMLGQGLRIGDDCGISEYCYFGAAGGVTLGNDVIMGQYVSFHAQNHNFDDPSRPIRVQGVTSKGIRIGNNVWIGAKATFLDGAEVGDGSVVAAGAVVNSVFPPYAVIAGVPARLIRRIGTD
jgi:acetyltransferase-like isoleucine patch superfamily enzyme